ncbi:O-antigen ligase family protein [Oceanirhabdus sp. W0125-5]|uniref:O-antigen ligase family protein n=1 Tax=Oceanirhabdus sp. W0125-5 TaxID=2999116 RepID=UPI0022F2D9D1|nr:O-antigen ligase family protein [Oceanirhabdus sp. W0125-5]WBW98655.1 O-antigen ligase family protein [Oceanirhabdus sp. W0125-5]
MKSFFKERKYLLPFIFLAMIYPLIVQAKRLVLKGDFYKHWNGKTIWYDFFTYYKSQALGIIAIILMFIVIYKFFTDKEVLEKLKKQKVIFILSGIYALLIIASTIFSANKAVAVFGFVESNQGMLTQLSYIVVFLSAILLIKDKYDVKIIINCLLVGSLIISAIAIFQSVGKDLWQSELGRKIMFMFNSDLSKELGKLKFKNLVYGTLYHKDYMGSYYAMIVPLTLGLTLLSEKILSKIAYGIVFAISTYTLIICESRGGLGGAIFGIAIVLIFTLRKVLTSWKKALIIGLSLCVIVVGVNLALKNKIGEQAKKNLGVITHNIKELFSENKEFDINTATELREVINEENRKGFVTNSESIVFSMLEGSVKIKDADANLIEYTINEKLEFTLKDERYKDYKIRLAKHNNDFILTVEKGRIRFWYDLTKYSIKLINNRFNEIENTPIEKWGFNGKERLLTVRGYIWSRSIPVLKNAKFIGYGPDTFIINFPQHDFIGKLYGYSDMNHIVDKPHNVYLQIALDNGILALIIFMSIILFYLFNYLIINIFKRGIREEFIISSATAAAICGYLVTGVINDNRVSVAPIFFMLIGIGFATMYITKISIETSR